MTDRSGAPSSSIVVIGGGISGLSVALEAAEAGCEVILLEKESYLGGRVARMNEYFPKLCPPSCGLEINFRRIKQNPRIKVFTGAEVLRVDGVAGAYDVEVKLAPRRVNDNCTACNQCVAACPVERADDFNYGMGTTKAIFLPHQMAYPMRYAIDEAACLGERCAKCVAYCAYDAIELAQTTRTMHLHAGAVVVATGWQPYDPEKIDNLSFAKYADVITNTMLERLAARNGPTKGQLVRPSNGGPLGRVAFVQCAGSRDEHHLSYCSGVCCTATFKQASYVRRQYPDAEIHVFYIDIRTMGTLEDFYDKLTREDDKLHIHKGKVAKITQGPDGRLRVTAEEIQSGERHELAVDLVVLATGMQPAAQLAGVVPYDALGFVLPEAAAGIAGVGCAKRPVDVMTSVEDATGGALRAIQSLRR